MKLCNFKSTTTNDYIRQTASLLGRFPTVRHVCPPSPAQTCARRAARSPPGSQSLPRRYTRLPRRLTEPRQGDRSKARQWLALRSKSKKKLRAQNGDTETERHTSESFREAINGTNKKKIKVRKETDPFGNTRRCDGSGARARPEGTTPPNRTCLTASGKLMRPSAVAYVLFLCDRPKPHARHANAGTNKYILALQSSSF